MTTAKEAAQIRKAYEKVLSSGAIARFGGMFRDAAIVRFSVPVTSPAYLLVEGVCNARTAIVQFQLRYASLHHGGPSTSYGVFGRLETAAATEDDWLLVDGPWRVGSGPFDTTKKGN